MRLLGRDAVSEVWERPARDDLDFPLILERSRPRDAVGLARAQAVVRSLAALPLPFRRIVEVRPLQDRIEIVQERFLGVTGRDLYLSLRNSQRLLPIDVWLGLAQLLCNAWSMLPFDGPASRLLPSPERFGVDIKRQLLIFPSTHQSLSAELTTEGGYVRQLHHAVAPELRVGAPNDARARVFGLAASLALFLTGDNPIRRRLRREARSSETQWDPTVHPGCSAELAQVLSDALQADPMSRPETPQALLEQFIAAARCAPASLERVAMVMLGAAPDQWKFALTYLSRNPEFLPVPWRDGGLSVLEDQLLEAMIPSDQLELSPAPRE